MHPFGLRHWIKLVVDLSLYMHPTLDPNPSGVGAIVGRKVVLAKIIEADHLAMGNEIWRVPSDVRGCRSSP
jgi:hypothetical protein